MSGQTEKHQEARSPSSPANTADILNETRVASPPLAERDARAILHRRSRRSFLVATAAVIGGGFGLRWLLDPTRQGIFDRMLGFNEKLGRKLFDLHSSAPEFPRSEAKAPRVNGTEGLSDGFDPSRWHLQVTGVANPKRYAEFADNLTYEGSVETEVEEKFSAGAVGGLRLTLDHIKALPRVEMTTELKCIEGWTTIVHWAGARFSDFAAKYPPLTSSSPPGNFPPYVSLVTPDRGYYVGWDLPSILHHQTLLCYEMNGEPLTLSHGGPLRLVSTAKYGIKQIKRIGRIAFTDQRPADYWAEQGYDWYSGL